jgi:enediyne biosynthesis thioesterase
MRTFEHQHIVSLEETNVVGNVYYANHVRWQGRCREMFLRAYAPEILDEFQNGLAIATLRVSCEYYIELRAFDEITLRMRAGKITQNRLEMLFDYVRMNGDQEELIARGEQEVAFMHVSGSEAQPTPIPAGLRAALDSFVS